ncbi:MAG TPA: class I SAM-dependent methyltransferase [Pseudonocardiaceae bacterium]|nr:class I SAM-dependent methyltransferase [Pseudonocardiaceae bacterium]
MIEMNGRHIDRPDAAERYWEDFYQDRGEAWSGRPNPLLVREVTSLTPGAALDVGCGEGGDAIWLARQGWRVTAVDVSATALRRAAAHAAEAGIVDGIQWARHDLAQSFPSESFDLVSAQFLHSPVAAPGERERILGRAAERVAPGGVLLIASHAGWPSWVRTPPFEYRFPTIPEILDLLTPPQRWRVEVAELVEREVTSQDGQLGHREDTVVRARRMARPMM